LYEFCPCRALYTSFVQKMNLLPKNFNANDPYQPWAYPDYIRPEIDITELWKSELQLEDNDDNKTNSGRGGFKEEIILCHGAVMSLKETHDHDVIEEFQKNGNVPWLTCESLPAGAAGIWVDGKPFKLES
jgi:hypothetical protein